MKPRNLFTPDEVALPAPPKEKSKLKEAEDIFAFQCEARRLPPAARQWRFAKRIGRQWKLDFAFLEHMVAVEIEGLVVRRVQGQLVVTGRHASVTGFREDCRKYAAAAAMGWTVLRFEQSMVRDREAIETTMRVLANKGWRPE